MTKFHFVVISQPGDAFFMIWRRYRNRSPSTGKPYGTWSNWTLRHQVYRSKESIIRALRGMEYGGVMPDTNGIYENNDGTRQYKVVEYKSA